MNTVNAEPSQTGVEPILLKIPSLNIEAPVEALGRQELTNIPPDGEKVFWYKDGVNPGGRGSAVIAGHFDDYTGPAIFYSLKHIKPGDMVYIIDRRYQLLMFQVDEVTSYRREEAPLQEVYQVTGPSSLTLVTCEGYYNREQQTHTHRLVVKAKRVGSYHHFVPLTERVQ